MTSIGKKKLAYTRARAHRTFNANCKANYLGKTERTQCERTLNELIRISTYFKSINQHHDIIPIDQNLGLEIKTRI